jgi:2'-phosphotransferase
MSSNNATASNVKQGGKQHCNADLRGPGRATMTTDDASKDRREPAHVKHGGPTGGGRGGRGGVARVRGRGRGGKSGRRLDRDEAISRALSSVLRHRAEWEGIALRPDGFARLGDVLRASSLARISPSVTLDDVQHVVRTNDKQRFTMRLSDDAPSAASSASIAPEATAAVNGEGKSGGKEPVWLIRANQGHTTVAVQSEALLRGVSLEEARALPAAFHGTFERSLPAIQASGLSRMSRRHVHLATQPHRSAKTISGARKSVDVLIHVDVPAAIQAGLRFFMSDNGVLLTEGDINGTIPATFFSRIERLCNPAEEKSKAAKTVANDDDDDEEYERVYLTDEQRRLCQCSHTCLASPRMSSTACHWRACPRARLCTFEQTEI